MDCARSSVKSVTVLAGIAIWVLRGVLAAIWRAVTWILGDVWHMIVNAIKWRIGWY